MQNVPAGPLSSTWWNLPPEIWLSLATIIAIILGPILAIQVEKFLEDRREQKRRKLWIFRELMITRSTRLSPRHVEALNGVQMEFSSKGKEKRVLDAWKTYVDHMNIPNPPDLNTWGTRSDDLLTDLLYEMGLCLGYDFEKVRIKREIYTPRYFEEIEREQNELRKAAIEVFKGNRPLKVDLEEEAPPAPHLPPGIPRPFR